MFSVPSSRYIFYPIPWYSFLIVLGAFIAILLASRQERKLGLKKDTILDLSLFLLPAGIIGARIYYVIFSWPQFRHDFWSVFRIWEGGLAIYGGIIAGLITLLLFCRIRKLPPLLLCDIIVPGLALAQSIGRWGNYFNMEAYGFRISDARFCFFPLAVQIPADGNTWHLATFFYESVWDFLVFLFLILYRRHHNNRKQGALFFSYAYLYACGRLIIEELRTDSLYAASSVRISQLLSVIICLLFIIYILNVSRHTVPKCKYFCLYTVICCLCLIVLLVYSAAPRLFSSMSHRHIILMLTVCSTLLVLSFFRCFIKYLEMESDYADNQV
jgi:phosphatidylglycerol:prolipoprotein diacylglycerol transferase